jgi:uncharacterized protein YndB with AHSA1/START domain
MTTENTTDRELVVTRIFNAPRALVFKAWTDPQHVVQWWGPNGFTTTIQEMDVRPGGTWRFILHGPDGTDYQNDIVYREVTEPERLVYDHLSEPNFQVTVTFTERDGKTELTVRMLFETADIRAQVVDKYGAAEGLKQTLGRLEEHLVSPADELQLTRLFDAPRPLVFAAWTDAKHLARWWGPHGFTNPVCELDARPGGAILINMTGPDGVAFPMKGTVHEIVAPERFVFTSTAGENEEGIPGIQALNTVLFTEEAGKTKVTLQVRMVCVAPEFAEAVQGMSEGWNQSLDRLAADVAAEGEK